MTTSLDAVARAFAAIAEYDRPEIWISLRSRADLTAEAKNIDAGGPLPLAGLILAVKDNPDVAGLPTTLGLPRASVNASTDAPAVARLRTAGALAIGKTNLDQFATGLVGTRSPVARCAVRSGRSASPVVRTPARAACPLRSTA